MMSHVYSFMLITLFLLTVRESFRGKGWRWLFLPALKLGLIILIRPTNALVILLVPCMAGNLSGFIHLVQHIFSDRKKAVALVLGFLIFPFAV